MQSPFGVPLKLLPLMISLVLMVDIVNKLMLRSLYLSIFISLSNDEQTICFIFYCLQLVLSLSEFYSFLNVYLS